MPLETHGVVPPQTWEIVSFAPVPYRVTFHGVMVQNNVSYAILKIRDQASFLLKVGASLHDIHLVSIGDDQRIVVVKDLLDQQTYALAIGKETYVPHAFVGIVRNRLTQKTFSFSHQQLKIGEQALMVPINGGETFYLMDFSDPKIPYVFLLKPPIQADAQGVQ
jgi:hypothetical protein